MVGKGLTYTAVVGKGLTETAMVGKGLTRQVNVLVLITFRTRVI